MRDGKARADFDAGEMKEALRRSMQDEITRLQQLIQVQSHQRQNLHNVQFPRPPSHQPQAQAPSLWQGMAQTADPMALDLAMPPGKDVITAKSPLDKLTFPRTPSPGDRYDTT